MAIITVKDLVKVYGSGDTAVRAANNLNLEIEKGMFTAIIGASGSGKSTLLNLLGGVDVPTSGEVILDGESISPGSFPAVSSRGLPSDVP